MSSDRASKAIGQTTGEPASASDASHASRQEAERGLQACPRCGHLMPDLKGGSGTICSVCGFKDSCCF